MTTKAPSEERLYAGPSNIDSPEVKAIPKTASLSKQPSSANPVIKEINQERRKPFRLSPTPIILMAGVAVVLSIILLRPQDSSLATANQQIGLSQPLPASKVNPKARIIINGVDQTEAVQQSPRFSLSWLEPEAIKWEYVDHVTSRNNKTIMVFRDGSERVLSSDVRFRLSDHVKTRLDYDRPN